MSVCEEPAGGRVARPVDDGKTRCETLDVVEKGITVRFGSIETKGDLIYSATDAIKLVLLHGAGFGLREQYRRLRLDLAEDSINSMAFDFTGFGETGGDLGDSSLQRRTEQACAVINSISVKPPLCLLGASMGAYTAVKLTTLFPVECLILLVPAMYHIDAYALPFSPAFTGIIRKPNSWAGSDAWEILNEYRGRLLIINAGKDDIIPQDVIERIYQAGRNAARREIYTVPHSPHLLIHHLPQEEHEYKKVAGLIRSFICG
jgi:pimeloyl-ACP methyl ester carboxylesterase